MTPTAHLLAVLRSASFRVSDESELQRQVAELLRREGIDHQREKILGISKSNRIDFWLPCAGWLDAGGRWRGGIGLELKVGQPAKSIYRQLLRYGDSGSIRELVIASTSHTALRLPDEACGKPLHSIQLRAWA